MKRQHSDTQCQFMHLFINDENNKLKCLCVSNM